MIDINFIVTCYDKIDYWSHLQNILQNYKKIKANIAFCYSGENNNQKCDIRIKNNGHIETEAKLIARGFNFLKNNGIKNWIKIGVDSWLLNEEKILHIFDKLEENNCIYAGSYWDNPTQLSTDIFFSNNTVFMEEISKCFWDYSFEKYCGLEGQMCRLVSKYGNSYIIPERYVVSGWNGLRFVVEPLGWVMQHDLLLNLKFLETYKTQNTKNFDQSHYNKIMNCISSFDWHHQYFTVKDSNKTKQTIQKLVNNV